MTDITARGAGDGVFCLEGRVAFVTGAGSGIGRSAAKMLAAYGAVVVCADIDADATAATAEEIAQGGRTAERKHVDVTDREQVRSAIESVAAEFGRLDILA